MYYIRSSLSVCTFYFVSSVHRCLQFPSAVDTSLAFKSKRYRRIWGFHCCSVLINNFHPLKHEHMFLIIFPFIHRKLFYSISIILMMFQGPKTLNLLQILPRIQVLNSRRHFSGLKKVLPEHQTVNGLVTITREF